jgi:hypothetical protein
MDFRMDDSDTSSSFESERDVAVVATVGDTLASSLVAMILGTFAESLLGC